MSNATNASLCIFADQQANVSAWVSAWDCVDAACGGDQTDCACMKEHGKDFKCAEHPNVLENLGVGWTLFQVGICIGWLVVLVFTSHISYRLMEAKKPLPQRITIMLTSAASCLRLLWCLEPKVEQLNIFFDANFYPKLFKQIASAKCGARLRARAHHTPQHLELLFGMSLTHSTRRHVVRAACATIDDDRAATQGSTAPARGRLPFHGARVDYDRAQRAERQKGQQREAVKAAHSDRVWSYTLSCGARAAIQLCVVAACLPPPLLLSRPCYYSPHRARLSPSTLIVCSLILSLLRSHPQHEAHCRLSASVLMLRDCTHRRRATKEVNK